MLKKFYASAFPKLASIRLILQESRPTPSRRAAFPHSPPPSPTISSWSRRSSCQPRPPGPSRDSRERRSEDGREVVLLVDRRDGCIRVQ